MVGTKIVWMQIAWNPPRTVPQSMLAVPTSMPGIIPEEIHLREIYHPLTFLFFLKIHQNGSPWPRIRVVRQKQSP